MNRASVSVIVASLAVATLAAQQEQPKRPVFRGGTQLVRVDVYPTGKDGRIVEGLTADDFEVFEDGKPQKVETFDFDRFETWTPDGERRDPKTQQDAYDLAADPAWRVFVIVIDPAAYNFEGQRELRAPLHEFIERNLGPHDLFGLLTTENQWTDLTLGQQTTVANGVLDSHEWTDPMGWQWQTHLRELCGGEMKHLDNEYTLLEGLVKLLGMVREEKKSILLVSNGIATPRPGRGGGRSFSIPAGPPAGMPIGRGGSMGHGDAIGGRSPSQSCDIEMGRLANIDWEKRFHDMLDDARRANVAFYPISPRGLEAPSTHITQTAPVSVAQTYRELDAINHRNDSLLTLAENTDGLAIVNTNDFAKGVRRIASDVEAYYILGYYPTNSQFDGTVRTIKVRLKSTGKTVRARHQYRAPTLSEVSPPPEPAKPSVPPAVKNALDRLVTSIESQEHDVDGSPTSLASASSLVEDPTAVRRGSSEPIAPFVFARTEHIRLEWRARGAVDRVEARLLDRTGHPLAAPIPAALDTSQSSPVVIAELPLTALAHGDYVLELTVAAGAATEQKFTAFRVK